MPVETAPLQLETTEEPRSKTGSIMMVVILTIASFMELLDTSIANVSLPNIAGNLSATTEEASWIISSYLVANAVIVPITGWLATRFGRKRFYMACVIFFTVASFLCGIAFNLEMLVFCRVLQGLAGGSLVPLEQSFIADLVPAEKRGIAFSIYGLTLVTAPIFAPALGGWITDNYSWHWIFFINIPIGLLSLFLTWTFVHEPQRTIDEREKLKKENIKIDWVGLGLITVGIGALTVVLDKGNREDWFESSFIVTFATIAFVTLLIGFTWEYYQENPIVDVRLLANRGVLAGSTMLFAVAFMVYGSLVLLPLMAQTVLDYNAQTAGILMSPGAIISLFLMPLAGYLVKRIEARVMILLGLICASLALWNLSNLSIHSSFWDLAIARLYQSFGTAFLFVPITTAAFRGVPTNKIDNASSLMGLGINVGGSMGIALLATLLAQRTQFHTSKLSVHASIYNSNYSNWINQTAQYLQQQGISAIEATNQAQQILWAEINRQAAMLAFLDAFYLLTLLVLFLTPLVFLFRSGKATEEK